MTWDLTTPDGSEAISNGDNRIRELKTDIQTALRGNTTDGLEAKFPGADTANPIFRYRGLKGNTGARPASGDYGLYANTTLNTLQRDNGSSWEDIATLIPSGTVMLFYQAAAPTGWTKLTTQNDKALRVVSGDGGGSGGSTGLSTGITPTVPAHSHTVASHAHTVDATDLPLYLDDPVENKSSSTSGTQLLLSHDQIRVSGSDPWTDVADPLATSTIDTIPGTPALFRNRRIKANVDATSELDTSASGLQTSSETSLTLSTITLAYIDVILCSKD